MALFDKEVLILSFSKKGALLSKRVEDFLDKKGYKVNNFTVNKYSLDTNVKPMEKNARETCKEYFAKCFLLIFISATGMAVRVVAPFLVDKTKDPAILSIDELGKYVIPLVSGHIGGANEYSRIIAKHLGSLACVTTATDINNLFAVDEWAVKNNCVLSSLEIAKEFSASIVNGQDVGFYCDDKCIELEGKLPLHLDNSKAFKVGAVLTYDKNQRIFEHSLLLMPKNVEIYIDEFSDIDLLLSTLPNLIDSSKIDVRTISAINVLCSPVHDKRFEEFAKTINIQINTYSNIHDYNIAKNRLEYSIYSLCDCDFKINFLVPNKKYSLI